MKNILAVYSFSQVLDLAGIVLHQIYEKNSVDPFEILLYLTRLQKHCLSLTMYR
jgi:hypothetical protein